MTEKSLDLVKPNFGLKNIFKFQVKEGRFLTKNIINCLEGSLVVSVEFTLDTIFILFSDGKVISKGKYFGIKKTNNGKTIKDFEEVKFNDKGLNALRISSGNNHVILLDFNKHIWGFGCNKYQQTQPYCDEIFYHSFVKIKLPSSFEEMKIAQIYCINNKTMIIYPKNIFFFFGSTNEGNERDKINFNQEMTKKLFEFKKIQHFINDNLQRNNNNIIDVFIDSKKIFNNKYTFAIRDNYLRSQNIENLNKTIIAIKNNNEKKTKKKSKIKRDFTNLNKDANKLIELQNELEEKIIKITQNKEKFRKKLLKIEKEINQNQISYSYFIDKLDEITNHYENFEDQIDQISSEISELQEKFYDPKEDQILIRENILEEKKNIEGIKINKNALICSLQTLVFDREKKEKERYYTNQEIDYISKEEKEIIKTTDVIEDMIQVLLDNSVSDGTDLKNQNLRKYADLFECYNQIELSNISNINIIKPYMIIDDIINLSNKHLSKIQKNLKIFNSSIPDKLRIQLDEINKLLELKISLIIEQNNLIGHLANIFRNLEDHIKDIHRQKKKINDEIPQNEMIYKNLIILYLSTNYESKDSTNFSKQFISKLEGDTKEYKSKKKNEFEQLVSKSIFSPEEKFDLNLSKKTEKFDYDDDSFSTYKWVYFFFNL